MKLGSNMERYSKIKFDILYFRHKISLNKKNI